MTIFDKALELVRDDQIIGLGSGRASTAFIKALGKRVKEGLRVQGVPTSQTSADLAQELGIPLTNLDRLPLDLTVDGADEVDPQLNLIKGYGRALVREKIVAAASRRLIILVGTEKIVTRLGERGKLPVEVIPLALPLCKQRLEKLPGLREAVPYLEKGNLFRTDNGNHILDCAIDPIENPAQFEDSIRAIPGVVGTGLFIGMADAVLVGDGSSFELKEEMKRK